MRILAAIAHYGTKNRPYIERLLSEYRSMSFDVDIVILTEVAKNLGEDVEEIIGFPSDNPWSLPFAHKALFAKRVNDYDLFIYSEDDTLVTERNIQAFISACKLLPSYQIPGFIRFEEDRNGNRFYSSVHGFYRLEPDSVHRYGDEYFGYFTNLHSACFIMTQDQLLKAIASGGFLVEPYSGEYDMLCTAATDPYTRCGFRRLLSLSRLGDFELHHLPNVYVGSIGVPVSAFQEQIEALLKIYDDPSKHRSLFEPRSGLSTPFWDKLYYEPMNTDILSIIPSTVQRILSVGCGWGATEIALKKSGFEVSVIPMDHVVAAPASSVGVRVLEPNFDIACEQISTEKFDCLIFSNTLQYLSDPVDLLASFFRFMKPDGCVIISGPNMSYLGFRKRLQAAKSHGMGDLSLNGNFNTNRLHFTNLSQFQRWLRACDLELITLHWCFSDWAKKLAIRTGGLFNNWLAHGIVISASRK